MEKFGYYIEKAKYGSSEKFDIFLFDFVQNSITIEIVFKNSSNRRKII